MVQGRGIEDSGWLAASRKLSSRAFGRVDRRASLTAAQLAGGPSWFRYLSPASTKDL